MITNDTSELELTDEVSEFDSVVNIEKSKWSKVLSAGIENFIKRNPKLLSEGFGVSKEVVDELIKTGQESHKMKCSCSRCSKENQ